MKVRAAIFCVLGSLFGCAEVEMMSLRPQRAGPVPEVGIVDAGGGHLRYPLKGPRLVVRKRRERAMRKMAAICRGSALFRITREFTSEDSDTEYAERELSSDTLTQSAHYRVDAYRHVEFQCVQGK